MKRNSKRKTSAFPIWQITLPLAGVVIVGIGAITAVCMINGRYLFHLEATPQRLTVTTDVDKRDINQAEDTNTNEQITN